MHDRCWEVFYDETGLVECTWRVNGFRLCLGLPCWKMASSSSLSLVLHDGLLWSSLVAGWRPLSFGITGGKTLRCSGSEWASGEGVGVGVLSSAGGPNNTLSSSLAFDNYMYNGRQSTNSTTHHKSSRHRVQTWQEHFNLLVHMKYVVHDGEYSKLAQFLEQFPR